MDQDSISGRTTNRRMSVLGRDNTRPDGRGRQTGETRLELRLIFKRRGIPSGLLRAFTQESRKAIRGVIFRS